MKKLLVILLLTTPLFAQAMDETTCTAAGGKILTIKNHLYCESQISLNWWNARSWCLSLGSDLVDLSNICADYYQTGTCMELEPLLIGTDVWSLNVQSDSTAYAVRANGEIFSRTRSETYFIQALCL